MHGRGARAPAALRAVRPAKPARRRALPAHAAAALAARRTTTSTQTRATRPSSATARGRRSSSRPRAAGPTASTTTSPAPTPSRCGPTSPRRYPLDPRRTTVTGYSMGGFGTFKLATKFPDLFARAQPTVGALIYPRRAARLGALGPVPHVERGPGRARAAGALPAQRGQAAPLWATATSSTSTCRSRGVADRQPLMLAVNDQFAPAARFLDSARVVRRPAAGDLRPQPGGRLSEGGHDGGPRLLGVAHPLRDTGKLGTVTYARAASGAGTRRRSPPRAPASWPAVPSARVSLQSSGRRWRPAPLIAVRNRLDVTASERQLDHRRRHPRAGNLRRGGRRHLRPSRWRCACATARGRARRYEPLGRSGGARARPSG